MTTPQFLQPSEVAAFDGVVLDCRFALTEPDKGRMDFEQGHIPGAHYFDLEEHMTGEAAKHGGRHPLPEAQLFARTLASFGIDRTVQVLVYDDSNYAFAARAWWMLRAQRYPQPAFVRGGYGAWLEAGGVPEGGRTEPSPALPPSVQSQWPLCCDRDGLRSLLTSELVLVDAREPERYRGEHEPIDPIAGHIPGAVNKPWKANFGSDGHFLDEDALRKQWQDCIDSPSIAVYCGSGVTACVDLLALALLGRDDPWLYGGSWSDWCSYLEIEAES